MRYKLLFGFIVLAVFILFSTSVLGVHNQYTNTSSNFINATTHISFNRTSGTDFYPEIGGPVNISGGYGWIAPNTTEVGGGIIGEALSLSSGTAQTNHAFDRNDAQAFSFWIKTNSSGTSVRILYNLHDGDYLWGLSLFDSGADIQFASYDGSNECKHTWDLAGNLITDNEWNHFIYNKKAGFGRQTLMDIYINGVNFTGDRTVGSQACATDVSTEGLCLGSNCADGDPIDAVFDEFLGFDRYLTQNEIDYLYNTTYPVPGPPPPPPEPENFEITAVDEYDGSALSNLSTTYKDVVYSTDNGTLHIGEIINSSIIINFNISCNDSGGYFNRTFFNINLSANYEGSLFQAILRLNATEKISLNNISNGLFYNNNTFVSNSSNQNIYLKAGSYNFTFVHGDYFNKSQIFTISAMDNISETITGIYDAILNITGKYLVNGSSIPNFDSNISLVNGSGSLTESGSTSAGLVQFFILKNYQYNVSFDNAGYQLDHATVTVTAANTLQEFLVYTMNSFNFTFRDEITDEIIYENIVVEFISDSGTYNYTAYNGTLYVDLIVPTDYTLRYEHADYGRLREYLYTLTNRSHNEIDLYMLENSNSTEITVTVYDELTLNALENTIVHLQRYFLTDNEYRTVAMYTTDVAGKAYFDVELNNELYKFLVDSPWKIRRLTTEELYISSTTINLYISTRGAVAENFFEEEGIIGTLNFDNATQTFTATWTDSENTASQFCLYIKNYGRYGKTTINSSCSESSGGSIELGGLQLDQVNFAVFTATIDGTEVVLKTSWSDYYTDELNVGPFGAWLTSLMFILMAFLSTFHILAALLAVLALVFAKLMGIFPLDWGYIIIIVILTLIVAIVISMKRR